MRAWIKKRKTVDWRYTTKNISQLVALQAPAAALSLASYIIYFLIKQGFARIGSSSQDANLGTGGVKISILWGAAGCIIRTQRVKNAVYVNAG